MRSNWLTYCGTMLLYQPPYNDSFTSDVYCSNIPTYRVPSLQLWEQDLITLVHIPKTACLVNNIQVIYACLLCCDVNICVPEIHPTIQALSLVTCRGGRTLRSLEPPYQEFLGPHMETKILTYQYWISTAGHIQTLWKQSNNIHF